MTDVESLDQVQTPCFVVNIDVVRENCRRMRERCEQMEVNLRPHMKTHKTREIGEIMTGASKRCITVSTVAEAEYFADGGFEDILYAYVFSVDKLPRLKKLASRLKEFHVLVDSERGVELLEAQPLPSGKKWSTFLKIDCGYKRAGVKWDCDDCVSIATRIKRSDSVSLIGIYTHDGNSYAVQGHGAIKEVSNETAQRLIHVNSRLKTAGIEGITVATGSTPSCSAPGHLVQQLTEVHPGNYAFYDVQQTLIGSCSEVDIAGRVATRVLSHYPLRNQMLVDAGFLALSHDGGKNKHDTIPNGAICLIQGHPELRFFRMSQEVGIIEPIDGSLDFNTFPVGSLLYLLPYHACATAAMHPHYYLHSDDKIISMVTPCRGW